jgi:hypothetical protein
MKRTTHKFDSIQALAAAARDTVPHERAGATSQARDDDAFYGGVTFGKAVEMGLSGGYWKEGTKDMGTIALTEPDHGTHKTRRKPVAAYAGSRPSVARYLAGAPRHMITQSPAPTSKRVLRLGVHVGRVGSTKQAQILNRGAAILSAIHELEAAGHSIEVVALWRNADDRSTEVSIETLIKPAGAFFSPADCAFALCHAAFQRRLCWRIAEGCPEGHKVTRDGYGHGRGATFEDFDLHLGYLNSPRDYNTIEGARKRVLSELKHQLAKHNNQAA